MHQVEMVGDRYVDIQVCEACDDIPIGYTSVLVTKLPFDSNVTVVMADNNCMVCWKYITSAELAAILYEELYRLIWAMVWDGVNDNVWLLNSDELFGELTLELVKIVGHYLGKPYLELKALAITSMRYHLRSLLTKIYGTHRAAEVNMGSLSEDGSSLISNDGEVELVELGYCVYRFDLGEFVSGLSDDAKHVVLEVFNPSSRTLELMDLSDIRKRFVSSKGYENYKVTSSTLRRCMGWDNKRYKSACSEVAVALGATFD